MNSELKTVVDEVNSEAEHAAEQQALTEVIAVPAPQQTEMPFAMVDGEPYTEVPRDLYIPPDALQVFLEAFEGPLDLLLYLIRKQNIDILNIPIAEITRQYMGYIDVMQDLQLELAGEYLLMAAMLAEIKSRMLLPRSKSAEGDEEDDPRAELVRRLQEYERFKKAADDIDHLKRLDRDVMTGSIEMVERRVVQVHPDVTMIELLKAFNDVVKRSSHFTHHQIQRERLSQRQRMSEILAMLEDAEFVEFIRLFKPEEGRMGVTVTFISILELMKEGMLDIVQAEPYAPLHVRKASGRRNAPVENASGDAENEAALAQAELPDENVVDDEDDEPANAATEAAADELVKATDDTVDASATEIEGTTAVSEVAEAAADVEVSVDVTVTGQASTEATTDSVETSMDVTAETPVEAAALLSDEEAELAELARQIAELDAAEEAERAAAADAKADVDEVAPATEDKTS